LKELLTDTGSPPEQVLLPTSSEDRSRVSFQNIKELRGWTKTKRRRLLYLRVLLLSKFNEHWNVLTPLIEFSCIKFHESTFSGSLIITQKQVTYIETDMGNWCIAVTMGCECIESSLDNECSIQLISCLREFIIGINN